MLAKFIKDMKLDKSAYLREILKKGFEEDKRERLLSKYQAGELSAIGKTIGVKTIGVKPTLLTDLGPLWGMLIVL